MRFRINKTLPSDLTIWHKWFAWYPVKVKNELVWLEYVERKISYNFGLDTYVIFKHYRDLNEKN